MALRKLLGLMVIFAAGRSQHNHLLREGAIVHNVAFCTCCIWRGNTTSLLHGEILPVVATIIAYTIPTKPLQAVVCLNLWLTRKCFFFFLLLLRSCCVLFLAWRRLQICVFRAKKWCCENIGQVVAPATATMQRLGVHVLLCR